jgi:hypothetical protein
MDVKRILITAVPSYYEEATSRCRIATNLEMPEYRGELIFQI